MKRHIVIILLAVLLVGFATGTILSLTSSFDPDYPTDARSFIKKNTDNWAQLLLHYENHGLHIDQNDVKAMEEMFDYPSLVSFTHHPAYDAFVLRFNWLSPSEGDRYVQYEPNCTPATLLTIDPADWQIVQESGDICRWEGGSQGKGYIEVLELEPDWYYVEMYLPT